MRRGRSYALAGLGALAAAGIIIAQTTVSAPSAEAALGLAIASDMGVVSGQPTALATALAENGRAIGKSGTQAVTWKNGTLTDLGGGSPRAVNDVDQIVGTRGNAAMWQPDGTIVTLLPVGPSSGEAINNAGEVLVSSRGGPDARIGIWRPGHGYTELTPPGAAGAVTGAGINASGQVAMAVTPPSGTAYAARCDVTGCTALPNPAGLQVFGVSVYGINASGQIAGTLVVPFGNSQRGVAVTWKGNEVIVLGNSTGGSTVARTTDPINDRGDVIGSQDGSAVLWRDGKAINVAPGLRDATATAINNNGDVVGNGVGALGGRGFRWQNGQTVELPPLPILTLSLSRNVWVTGINNAGLIVGWTSALNVEGAPTMGEVHRATKWTIY